MHDDRLVNAVAEAALLGAMMLENRLIGELAGQIRQEHFAEAVHGRIFGAMLRFASKGMEVSALTLRPIFQHDKEADYGAYLDQLVDNPAAVAGAVPIARQVSDFANRRAMRDACQGAMEALATDLDRPIAEITGAIDKALWATESDAAAFDEFDPGDMVGFAETRDEQINANAGAAGTCNALVSDIDKLLGPLEGGQYTLLAGRPGMGKTSLASSMALGYAQAGLPGVYCFAESTADQIGLRVASDLSFAMGNGIEHAALKKGGLSAGDRNWLARVRERAKLLPLRYVPTRRCDIRRVWAIAARHKAMWAARGQKLGFVVVDHIGLYGASDADGRPITNGFERVKAISALLDRMKIDLDVHVIALSQLSRKVDERPNKRPQLSDLRESGDLEQDADNVLFAYREEVYLKEEEPKRGEMRGGKDLHIEWETDMRAVEGKMEIIMGKNRHGVTGKRTANFHGKYYAVRGGEVDIYSEENLLI